MRERQSRKLKKFLNHMLEKLDNADPKDIKRDVKIIIPKGFDVFGEKPLK
jgi:dihydropteroate synthase